MTFLKAIIHLFALYTAFLVTSNPIVMLFLFSSTSLWLLDKFPLAFWHCICHTKNILRERRVIRLHKIITLVLPYIISTLELMGIFVVTWTGLKSFWGFLMNSFRAKNYPVQYEMASGMATALTFKMAAEILKTVLIHDLEELAVLGAIVVLRGTMSVLLHFELKHSKHDMQVAHDLGQAVAEAPLDDTTQAV